MYDVIFDFHRHHQYSQLTFVLSSLKTEFCPPVYIECHYIRADNKERLMAAKGRTPADPEGRRPSSDFPKHAIETVLAVAQVIEDKNGGNPLPPLDIALALGVGPGSSNFRDL